MKYFNIVSALFMGLLSVNAYAATVDGAISSGEYQWDTDGVEGSNKWNTHGGFQEYNDGSGGDNWDISFLGTSIVDGKFQFAATGGKIISGRETNFGSGIYLSDFALDVNGDSTDPTTSSAGFEYAIRLLGVNDSTGIADFALLSGGSWTGADIYGNHYAPKHITETYKMVGGTTLATFSGAWSFNGGNSNVLEGEFDLSYLNMFDPELGGQIATYLTMTCVNDEALVYADIPADISSVPVPAAFWLFSPALFGFMAARRRMASK